MTPQQEERIVQALEQIAEANMIRARVFEANSADDQARFQREAIARTESAIDKRVIMRQVAIAVLTMLDAAETPPPGTIPPDPTK